MESSSLVPRVHLVLFINRSSRLTATPMLSLTTCEYTMGMMGSYEAYCDIIIFTII